MAKKNQTVFSRKDLRYWEERVYRPIHGRGDEYGKKSGFYAIRIQAHGERRGVSLRETTQREAAKSARDLDTLVQLKGWELGLKEFRGEIPKPRNNLTLGDYLAEVATTGYFIPRTLQTYSTKVRKIAADVGKIKMPEIPTPKTQKSRTQKSAKKLSKFDYVNGGTQIWNNLVDAVPLRDLASDAVHVWQSKHLNQFLGNPAKYKSATKTTNSCIRAGKALFTEDVRKRLPHVILPDPVPFGGMKTQREEIKRYRSEIGDPTSLLIAGSEELANATTETEVQSRWKAAGGSGKAPYPTPIERIRAELSASRKREAFKVLILGLSAGLRRGEIDLLMWSQIDFKQCQIVIETTEVHQPKADSEGDIPVDQEIMDLFKKWQESSKSRFLIDGVEPKVGCKENHYRANRAQVELLKWLKSKGIKARNPIHSLRKEFGSIICAKAGVYVASLQLRHANISMTEKIYIENRTRATTGLGSAFSS